MWAEFDPATALWVDDTDTRMTYGKLAYMVRKAFRAAGIDGRSDALNPGLGNERNPRTNQRALPRRLALALMAVPIFPDPHTPFLHRFWAIPRSENYGRKWRAK